MIEPSSSNTALNTLMDEIFKLSSISTFNALKPTINQITMAMISISPALDSQSASLLEPPTCYLQHVMNKYHTELKNDPDV